MSFGGELIANIMLPVILDGEDFTIPTVDLDDELYTIPGDITAALYQPVVKLTNEELTEQSTDGEGTFDAIMGGFRCQLEKEYKENRISGAEYTKAFIALSESAMSNAVQFLISRDQAFWQAVSAQANGITARVALATAKVQYAQAVMQAQTAKADYAVTKLRLATEDAQYGQIKYQVDNILPAQLEQAQLQNDIATYNLAEMLPLQKAGLDLQNQKATFEVVTLLPLQESQLTGQIATQAKQLEVLDFQLDNIMPAQLVLTKEQSAAQRAQTLDTRVDPTDDGATVAVEGLLERQKALYTQQITSYQKDSKLKAAKMFMDAWSTRDAIVEFTAAQVPDHIYLKTEMEEILTSIRTDNDLGSLP